MVNIVGIDQFSKEEQNQEHPKLEIKDKNWRVWVNKKSHMHGEIEGGY